VSTTKDLTVVVPTRNVEHWLDGCLASIERCDPAEVIVVDGLSSDRTRDIAREHGARGPATAGCARSARATPTATARCRRAAAPRDAATARAGARATPR